MRLYVPHDERRPQPEPAVTNDGLAFAVGIGAWLIGLAVVLGMLAAPVSFDPARVLTTIAVGLALGITGLLVTRLRRRAR
ncbi:DUF2530 domain-containing protein [Microcella sp.]|uniref:DUF2530 domain-containing protein n=1 Tax=Microcella sp. TaxID=1913979 RepID=UPI00299F7628|nr:DUF2530 domain-containing protein [Microcella sp.]MDX2025251.1 DUF2530 domain-containing protein [Microcella sp.]